MEKLFAWYYLGNFIWDHLEVNLSLILNFKEIIDMDSGDLALTIIVSVIAISIASVRCCYWLSYNKQHNKKED
jgi:hypothetical protein